MLQHTYICMLVCLHFAHRSVLVHGTPEMLQVKMYFCTFQFVEFLVNTAAQSSKLVLCGGGLELPSLGGSSPRAEGGISWEYAEDS